MKILIADDQPILGELLADQVRSWGYQPVLVQDGLAALAAMRQPDGPRLALLDWIMPGLDGIQVCRQLRQDGMEPYPYLMLMTGLGGREAMLEGLEAGADDFLIKPVDPSELKVRLGAGRRIVCLQDRLLASQQQLQHQATRDGLTGVLNRSAILDILSNELARASRENGSLGVILADVDHFKHINDEFGHLVGDDVLRQLARRMRAALRPYDYVGRYGGEEFLLVLPGCDPSTSADLAERMRSCVVAQPMECECGPIAVTLSLGVTAWVAPDSADVTCLLRTADHALYGAKNAGRNRFVIAQKYCQCDA